MGTPTTDRPLRVIQWTTGNIGRRSLHAIIGRDDMELVGVFAHGADKVGVDAAELAGLAGAHRGQGHQRHRRAGRAAARRLLLQPAVAQHRRAGPAAGVRHQRVLQRRVDHRRQAVAGGPRADPKGLRNRQFHDLRQRCAPRDDQPGRHGAERVPASASTRSASPSRWTARPTNRRAPRPRWDSRRTLTPRARRERAQRERGVRRIGRDDGRRHRRHPGPDDLRRRRSPPPPATATSASCRSPRARWPESSATTAAGSATATSSASGSTGPWAITSPRRSRSSTATSSRCSGYPTCAPWCTACRPRTGPSRDSWAWA